MLKTNGAVSKGDNPQSSGGRSDNNVYYLTQSAGVVLFNSWIHEFDLTKVKKSCNQQRIIINIAWLK